MTEAIFVVDDDEAVRDSLAFLLESAGHEVLTFANPVDALEALSTDVACLITDVRMPGMNGLELVERARTGHPLLPILVMTGHADVPMAVEAMKKGAGDFLEKPFDDDRLLSALDIAIRPHPPAPADPAIAARVAALSMRERQVMERLMTGQSNKEIGRDLSISPRTVEIYRSKVMAKLEAETYADLIRIGMKAGLDRN